MRHQEHIDALRDQKLEQQQAVASERMKLEADAESYITKAEQREYASQLRKLTEKEAELEADIRWITNDASRALDEYIWLMTRGFYRIDKAGFIVENPIKWTDMETKYDFINKPRRKQMLRDLMDTAGILYKDIQSSPQPPDPEIYNYIDMDKLLPLSDSDDYNPLFDVLMRSLSGGKDEAKDHLELCLIYKYHRPENYKIPAIIIYGEGSIGKNMLFERIMPTIFGKQHVGIIRKQDAFGNFNNALLGKLVTFIDEMPETEDIEELKALISNPTMMINAKFVSARKFDNTAMYWISSNKDTPPLYITRGYEHRRWSLIPIKRDRPFHYWFAEYLNEAADPPYTPEEALDIWERMEFDKTVFSDPNEVAKWLKHLTLRWQHKFDMTPKALHGADFEAEAIKNEKIEDVWVRDFFDAQGIAGFTTDDAYEDYCRFYDAETNGAKQNFIKKRRAISMLIRTYVDNNELPWESEEVLKDRHRVIKWERNDLGIDKPNKDNIVSLTSSHSQSTAAAILRNKPKRV